MISMVLGMIDLPLSGYLHDKWQPCMSGMLLCYMDHNESTLLLAVQRQRAFD